MRRGLRLFPLALIIFSLFGCSSSSDNIAQQDYQVLPCIQPPKNQCYPPNSANNASSNWRCAGCTNCYGGSFATSACDIVSGDCRIFATGCIPQGYQECSAKNVMADQRLGGYCQHCFQTDAGPNLPECDKLPGILDAGKY